MANYVCLKPQCEMNIVISVQNVAQLVSRESKLAFVKTKSEQLGKKKEWKIPTVSY